MRDHRSLKLDLLALGLFASVMFLAAALLSYAPGDPLGELPRPLNAYYRPDLLVYPPGEQVTNACGRLGALVAEVLFRALGLGAYYLAVSAAALDAALLLRRRVDSPVLRLLGWLASLFGVTSLAATLVPWASPGPVIGSGGYLGALGREILEAHFALAGSLILTVSLIVGGLMLCTDYAIFQVAQAAVRGAGKGLLACRRLFAERPRTGPAKATAARRDDLGSEQELSVVLCGKPAEAAGRELESPSVAEEETANDPGAADETPVIVKPEVRTASPGTALRPHFRVSRRLDRKDREAVMSRLDAASHENPGVYELPDVSLLIEADEVCFEEQVKEVRRKAKILERTFADFGFTVKVVEIETGPVIAQYEVELEPGLRVSRITGLADDLAIALRVPSVRIVAPLPGKNTVGIEVPNEARQIVRLREVIEESGGTTRKMKVPLFLGKDVSGKPMVIDLATLPHLLIAGRTGTGKSVCLNAIICSILMTRKPDEVRLLLIDPKMVELSGYGRLPHLMHPVVTDMRKAEAILAWAVEKMEERYALLARAGVRHISSYNQLGEEELMERLKPECDEERQSIPLQLPFIVIIADEMADLMMTAGKEVEQHIIRLAQKSRAVGIHLILATQKPTVDVITGLIKSNLPARIAFQVSSRTDSRVVLDEMGADKLLGNGDMLFLWPGTSTLLRGQGTYLTDDEINRIVDFVSTGEQNFVHELINLKVEQPGEGGPGPLKKRDELYEAAVDIVVREGRGSVSLLQRTLGVGYGRAARLIDFMAEDGIVGPYAGSQAREVIISLADWERMQGHAAESGPTPVAGPPQRSTKVRLDDEPQRDRQPDEEDAPRAARSWKPPTGGQAREDGREHPRETADAGPDDDEEDEEETYGGRARDYEAEIA